MRKWDADELEHVTCDCCGASDAARQFTRADGLRVVECAQCGLAFLNPRPRSELIRLLYGEDYFTGASADRGEGGLRPGGAVASPAGGRPRVLDVICETFGGVRDKDVLEVGCASGHLLRVLAADGARAKGIELSEYAAALARRDGLDVTTGSIEDFARVRHGCADILVALEVIEHVSSPRSFLQQAFRLLRPGGVLLVSTPNYACSRRFGERWLGFNASFEHIYFFSADVLQRLAQSTGFSLRHLESTAFLGGPKPPTGFVEHQWERIRTVRYLIEEAGMRKGLEAILSRASDHLRCGVGHTLLMGFARSA